MLLEKKNAENVIIATTMISGLMILLRETPDVFMASSSRFSPMFPNVISEASKIARGRANGTMLALEYRRNSPSIFNSSPFPTRSSIYFQRNCISSMKITRKKVRKRGPINDFITK